MKKSNRQYRFVETEHYQQGLAEIELQIVNVNIIIRYLKKLDFRSKINLTIGIQLN